MESHNRREGIYTHTRLTQAEATALREAEEAMEFDSRPPYADGSYVDINGRRVSALGRDMTGDYDNMRQHYANRPVHFEETTISASFDSNEQLDQNYFDKLFQNKEDSYLEAFGHARPHPDAMDFTKASSPTPLTWRIYPKDALLLIALIDEVIVELQSLFPSLLLSINYGSLIIVSEHLPDTDDDGNFLPPAVLAAYDDNMVAIQILPAYNPRAPSTSRALPASMKGRDGTMYELRLPIDPLTHKRDTGLRHPKTHTDYRTPTIPSTGLDPHVAVYRVDLLLRKTQEELGLRYPLKIFYYSTRYRVIYDENYKIMATWRSEYNRHSELPYMLNNPQLQLLGYVKIHYGETNVQVTRPIQALPDCVGLASAIGYGPGDDGRRYPLGHPLCHLRVLYPDYSSYNAQSPISLNRTIRPAEYRRYGITTSTRDAFLHEVANEIRRVLPPNMQDKLIVEPDPEFYSEQPDCDYHIFIPQHHYGSLSADDRATFKIHKPLLAIWRSKDGYIDIVSTTLNSERRYLNRIAIAQRPLKLPTSEHNTKFTPTTENIDRRLQDVYNYLNQPNVHGHDEDHGGSLEIDFVSKKVWVILRQSAHLRYEQRRVTLISYQPDDFYFFNHFTAARFYLQGITPSGSFRTYIEFLFDAVYDELLHRSQGRLPLTKDYQGQWRDHGRPEAFTISVKDHLPRPPTPTDTPGYYVMRPDGPHPVYNEAMPRVVVNWSSYENCVQILYEQTYCLQTCYDQTGTRYGHTQDEVEKLQPLHAGDDGKRYFPGHPLRVPWYSERRFEPIYYGDGLPSVQASLQYHIEEIAHLRLREELAIAKCALHSPREPVPTDGWHHAFRDSPYKDYPRWHLPRTISSSTSNEPTTPAKPMTKSWKLFEKTTWLDVCELGQYATDFPSGPCLGRLPKRRLATDECKNRYWHLGYGQSYF